MRSPQPQPGGAEVTSRSKLFANEAGRLRRDEGAVDAGSSSTKERPSRSGASVAEKVQDKVQREHRRRANADGVKNPLRHRSRIPFQCKTKHLEQGAAQHRHRASWSEQSPLRDRWATTLPQIEDLLHMVAGPKPKALRHRGNSVAGNSVAGNAGIPPKSSGGRGANRHGSTLRVTPYDISDRSGLSASTARRGHHSAARCRA